jgi:hypothetical protein
MRFCCPHFIGNTAPSDSLPAARHFTFRAYRSAPYGNSRAGEGLPSSKHNFPNMPIPIHRRVLLRCTSKGFTHSMVFAQTTGARLPLVLFRSFLTVRQDSLDVTACCFARSPFRATLSQGFNLRISPPVACQLRGDLALTSTGLSPARLCLAWLGAHN